MEFCASGWEYAVSYRFTVTIDPVSLAVGMVVGWVGCMVYRGVLVWQHITVEEERMARKIAREDLCPGCGMRGE